MKKISLLLTLVGSLALPAVAADYFVVVPIKGRTGSPVDPNAAIAVSLQGAPLPNAVVGQAYAYDLKSHLVITGDPALDPAQASWQLQSPLPGGLTLSSDGAISGTPSAGVSGHSFTVQATYKTKAAQQTYSMSVTAVRQIADFPGGYRAWDDDSYAANCEGYRRPTQGYAYAGSTGDGRYRIQPAGQAPTDVYCDMTTDGGGWTMVAGVDPNSRRHLDSATVAWSAGYSPSSYGKLSDAFINAAKSGHVIGFRLVSGGLKNYFPSGCQFAAGAAVGGGDCATYTMVYSDSPAWVSTPTLTDGCPQPTSYTGVTSAQHAACNGSIQPAGNGGLIYGRTGNNNTAGMVRVTEGSYLTNQPGVLWVR